MLIYKLPSEIQFFNNNTSTIVAQLMKLWGIFFANAGTFSAVTSSVPHKSFFLQAGKGIISYYYMVKHRYIHDLSRLHQTLRDSNILPAGAGVA
jgi:hypothetical protein